MDDTGRSYSDSYQLGIAQITETDPLFGTQWSNKNSTRLQNRGIVESSPYLTMTAAAGLCFLTIWGNASVIMCVLKSRRISATIYSIYILSLACADLMIGVVAIPAMTSYNYYGYWHLGNAICTAWSISDYCCCNVSVWHLTVISYDRERAVKEPLKYRSSFTKSRARTISAIMWTLVFVVWTPSITVFNILDGIHGKLVVGVCGFKPDKYFRVASLIMLFYLPISFMVVEFVRLILCLRNRDVNKMGNTVSHETATPANSEPNVSVDKPLQNEQKLDKATTSNTKDDRPQTGDTPHSTVSAQEALKASSQNSQAIRILGIMIALFFLCWVPWCLLWLIEAFCASCISSQAYTVAVWLTYVNSCINPYLYFIFNADFRSTLAQLYGCRGTNLKKL